MLFERARGVFPGGVNSPARALKHLAAPLVANGASGPYLYTDRGRLVDYCMAFGAIILGHAHPRVKNAVAKQLERGWIYALLTEEEVAYAERIKAHVPSIEKMRIVNSGTEATMNAVRLARGYTRRDVIIKFDGNFHGSHDYVLVKAGSGAATWGVPTSAGVPQDVIKLTAVVPYNDVDAFVKAVREVGGRLAAVIVEPIAANYGLIIPDREFIKALREETERAGALLIFDEVVTGFRVGLSGAQGHFGVRPDLTTLGKVVGGGFPIGIFGGRADVMDMVAPSGPVYNAGTYNAHPVSVAAGLAVVEELERGEPYKIANEAAERLARGIEDIAGRVGFDVVVKQIASMFQLYFRRGDVKTPQDVRESDERLYLKLHELAIKHGVYLAPSQYETNFTSAAHTRDVVETTLAALEKAFTELKSQVGK
ncbi:glutamate-1-semialdehyde 2,1-aminomutase [Pyrobaculum neutrophilum]|uniref:Glutamate-1-semialdehyde 2,1-aminomutase n=1 Tax=Pyrobaculum neutrophilum (strain DSM 2338 / JCM 9278 / NBRC 100436 / V24Sta) TaxID=444157 RepID=GSA_PYRNV|nr:glutamate-1-semialdehyde 2,1-aminomutase [Pyrobaculum neutrophilum]B1YBL3.1 RecName: Full=Glutamate-1-semialdehyde 2,1-aminomutase; Short=GSA; AltName: Full=Glutamate-1-semialdehyde aminotransferase; Short=GSA-AT [Pyrobaculum neutrophilum V24Sta]ACB40815.1 glutamate-1-semialdehyde-2,1-aminomutase [Pyrobaculum neutrophilum V24Sta]